MVAGILSSGGGSSGVMGKVVVALGAAFLLSASYMTLKGAVTPRDAGSSKGNPPVTVSALERLPPGELADEAQALRDDYARDPLDATAVLDLSRVAEVGGNVEASERLRMSAGEMMPRATGVQAEALEILLRRRDFDQVMGRLDGLIRARPAEARNFFALAAEISADPEGSRAVARMLSQNPPWRAQFVGSLLAGGQAEAANRIITDLRAIGAPTDDAEVRALIDSYLRQGDVDRAYAIWLSNLSEAEMKDVKRVYDGGFGHPLRGLRFDWTVTPAEGLVFRLFPRNTASMDQTLQFDFADFSGTFSNLSQVLRLNPGRYSLSGEARFEEFASPTGLVFRLSCLDGGRATALDQTAPLPQSTQWIEFDKTFQVPATGCANQVLQLHSQAPLKKAQITRGMVAIDAIKIDKMPELAP